jgi:hypothetical protein
MIDPATCCLYVPVGLADFKLRLFTRIADKLTKLGGRAIWHDETGAQLDNLPPEITPIVGCTPALTPLFKKWQASNRKFVYWDRGYMRRVFATWLPKGVDGGYYRWHINSYQMMKIRDVPDDRFRMMDTPLQPWKTGGRHVVIAAPTRTYAKFHETRDWIADTIDALARVTDRQLVIRDKEQLRRPLQADLEGAHALVTHGSNTAVEAAILGCPVFVHPTSAAALVGLTDIRKIEQPIYPERQAWANSLCYCHFNERELVDGTLWRLIE